MDNASRLDAVANALAKHRYSFVPVRPNSKATQEPNWQRYCHHQPDPETTARWLRTVPHYGVGIVCGPASVIAIDVDCRDPERSGVVKSIVTQHLGESITRIGQEPKFAVLYRVQGQTIRKRKVGEIDILGAGSYLVCFGIHPATGQPYRWEKGSPLTTPLSDLPLVTGEQIDALCSALTQQQGMSTRPPQAHAEERNRGAQSNPQRNAVSGLVIDGRDQHLTDLIWSAYCQGHATAEKVAGAAWKEFTRTTDLTRPKQDGQNPWAYADALAKARYLLARGKPRVTAAVGFEPFWTEARKREFASFVALYVAEHRLPRSLVTVSNVMLSFFAGNDVCWASVETLAKRSGLEPDSVKTVRRQLVRHRLWTASNNSGGAFRTAEYRPARDCLNTDPREPRSPRR